jgi:hypothetical protein
MLLSVVPLLVELLVAGLGIEVYGALFQGLSKKTYCLSMLKKQQLYAHLAEMDCLGKMLINAEGLMIT